MRELDILLSRYFEYEYALAGEDNKSAFRELLALPDPDLIGYLLGGEIPADSAIANVVSHIRDNAHS